MAQRVFDLYSEGRYEEALRVVEGARPDHPEEDGRLTFWEACLLGVSGAPDEALRVLEAGMERGLWWAPDMLADSDLDAVRELKGWDEVLHRCSELAAEFSATHRPETQHHPASVDSPAGTVITLHGGGADPAAHADQWRGAVPDAWTVVAPVGTVPVSKGEWGWAHDGSTDAVLEQIRDLELSPPVVLSGFSQGGGVAAALAWEGAVEASGLVLVCPSLGPLRWDPGSHRRVPTYIIAGDLDRYLPACLELKEGMERGGVPVRLDELPGVGHRVPDDFPRRMRAALEWVISV